MNTSATDLTEVRARFAVALEMYVSSDLTMREIGAYLGMAVSHVHYAIHAEARRQGMRIVFHRGRRELRPIGGEGAGEQAEGSDAA